MRNRLKCTNKPKTFWVLWNTQELAIGYLVKPCFIFIHLFCIPFPFSVFCFCFVCLIAVPNVSSYYITCECRPETQQHWQRPSTGTIFSLWKQLVQAFMLHSFSVCRIFWNAIQYSEFQQRKPYSTLTLPISAHPKCQITTTSFRNRWWANLTS